MARACRPFRSSKISIYHQWSTKAYPKGSSRCTRTRQSRLTISFSGVLAASLEQSRRSWSLDGVFERYWAKPSKKRTHDAPNPAPETMTKLGICSMAIEPHTFEVTLYTVKEPRATYQAPLAQPPFSTNPSGPPQGNTSGAPTAAAPFPGQRSLSNTQATLPNFRDGFAHFDPHGPPPPIYHPFASSQNSSRPQNITPSNLPPFSSTSRPTSKNSPDPVIQMLATRAASDHSLKALMKVVASGRATQTELREFQNHIDELNTEISAGRGPPSSRDQGALDQSASGELSTSTTTYPKAGQASYNTVANYSSPFQRPSLPIQLETPIYSQYAPPSKSKTTTQYKSDISAIVFDFGGKGDRFSFPRFSILEYLPGGTQVIVSFLIIRKGGEASSGSYKDHMSYYQTVTLRLSSPQPRTLEPLSRVVAPVDEVRQYMNDVFDKMKPAETVYLATRLPRAKESEAMDLDKANITSEKTLIKPVYSPPSFIVPMAA